MKIKRTTGYSNEVAQLYIPTGVTIYSLSTELTPQFKWVDGKPTKDVAGYQSWFIGEGTEPFKVKFTEKIKLPSMFSKVRLSDLQACEVGSNVYFKAKAIEVLK